MASSKSKNVVCTNRPLQLLHTGLSGPSRINIFGRKGIIIGIGIVGKFPYPTIGEVLLVDGLKHDLLSSS